MTRPTAATAANTLELMIVGRNPEQGRYRRYARHAIQDQLEGRTAHEQGADFLAALLATADQIQAPSTVGTLPVPSSPPFGRDGQEVAIPYETGDVA